MGSHEDLVRRAFDEVWREGEFGLLAEDYVDHNPAPGLPGTIEGLRALRERTLDGFPDYQVQVDQVVAGGDLVAARLTNRGTHRGIFMGIPGTGREMEWATFAIFRVQDGKLVERWGLADGLSLMRQLGMEVRPPS